jgi:hypothetical protein
MYEKAQKGSTVKKVKDKEEKSAAPLPVKIF